MTEPIDLSDETIAKLADQLATRLVFRAPAYPSWQSPPFYQPYYYPFVTSQPNSGSVLGSSYGGQVHNG